MTKNEFKKDIAGAAVFAAVFVLALISVYSMPAEAKMWPQFICVLGIICCLALGVKSWISMKKVQEQGRKLDSRKMADMLVRASLVVLIIAAWFLLMKTVGFIVTGSAALVALMCVPGKPKSVKQTMQYILIAIVFTIILWLTFGKLLGAKLPTGFLI